MSGPLPRLHVRGRLFVGSISVVLVVILVAGVFAELELRRWLEARIEGELETDLHAARFAIERAPGTPDDAFADELGAAFDTAGGRGLGGVRVTVIDAGGVVVGDSEVEPARLPSLENHATRPEVVDANSGAGGRGRRRSATVGKDMLYLAERFTRPAEMEPVPALRAGVIRVAADYDDVDAAVSRLRTLLAMAGGLGLLAAIGISALASQLLSRTLRDLVVYARSLAAAGGGVGARFDDDDIGGVAGTLQRLADDLGRSVAELAAERDRFATVLEAMREGVIALDKNAKILLINQAARDMFRLLDDPSGRALLEVARAPALDDVVKKARGGEIASVEIDLLGPTLRTVLVRAAPVRNGGAVVVMHDVSDVRRLERVRRDFVSNVSHELRTPVSVIRASAETLRESSASSDGIGGADARRFVEAIERNATRLTRLVADLLDLSRIESGQAPLTSEALRVADVCRRAVENVDAEARKGHAISVDVDDALVATGDAKAVDQVLVNLIENAVHYTPPGSHIRIRAFRAADPTAAAAGVGAAGVGVAADVAGAAGAAGVAGVAGVAGAAAGAAAGAVRIEVADDGPGIATHHRERLFERFYRVDAGRSRDVGGTGLGLAIVKHLVEAMGGVAGVEAARPRGAVFWFTLPLVVTATSHN